MKIHLRTQALEAIAADVRILPIWRDPKAARPTMESTDRELDRALTAGLRTAGFRGDVGSAALLNALRPVRGTPALIVAGLGPPESAAPWRLERAVAAAVRLATRSGLRRAVVPFAGRPAGIAAADWLRALVRGAFEGSYTFDRYLDAEKRAACTPLDEWTIAGAPAGAAARRAAEEGRVEGETLGTARDLANLPANELTPATLAGHARRLSRRYGLDCRVLGPAELERRHCRALLAVGQGSRQPPRLIVLRHRGARGGGRPVVFIGKTITFDSGGLCLKPGKGQEWMRYDKCGGLAVLAILVAAARLRLPQPLVGLLPAAENMPDGGAVRPGDIVRSAAGPTIEIINTDAEGRLVLADALALSANYRPRAIVDIATLTGGVIAALGHQAAAVLSPDDGLRADLVAAGERSGDRLWPLPLWPEYEADLRSPFADLRNVGESGASTIIGATFLKRFVPAGVPWAHLDIAGTAWDEKARPDRGPGATLFGLRLALDWLRTAPRRETRP